MIFRVLFFTSSYLILSTAEKNECYTCTNQCNDEEARDCTWECTYNKDKCGEKEILDRVAKLEQRVESKFEEQELKDRRMQIGALWSNKKQLEALFEHGVDLTYVDTSDITDMTGVFAKIDFKNYMNMDLSRWNTSRVTSMKEMFYNFKNAGANPNFFNSLASWDVSNVEDMTGMFADGNIFNANLSSWNTSRAPNMYRMFINTGKVTGNLKLTSTNMTEMFSLVQHININFTSMDASSNTTMEKMFFKTGNDPKTGIFAGKFAMDTSSVTNMKEMFSKSSVSKTADIDISDWDTSKVENMYDMFWLAKKFNGDISDWNTSNVLTMQYMFHDATSFNADVSRWNVSRVTDFLGMFMIEKGVFNNHDLSNWNINKNAVTTNMFDGTEGNTLNKKN